MYKHHKVTIFDKKDFYLLVSKKVFNDALTFAEIIIKLNDHDKKSLYHSHQLLRFNQDQTWIKKGDLFDVLLDTCNFLIEFIGRTIQ